MFNGSFDLKCSYFISKICDPQRQCFVIGVTSYSCLLKIFL